VHLCRNPTELRIPVILFLTLTTLGTSVLPLSALKNANRNSFGHQYNSTNGSFYGTQTGIGSDVTLYSFAFASNSVLVLLIGTLALARFILPGEWKLPKYYKPLIRRGLNDSNTKQQEDGDAFLDKIFHQQDRHRKLSRRFHALIESRVTLKTKPTHNVSMSKSATSTRLKSARRSRCLSSAELARMSNFAGNLTGGAKHVRNLR
jgi:hypothetical protein